MAALLVMSATAAAQPGDRADRAFERGREALQIGNYAEACAAFEEAQALDPEANTLFNIALCSEQLGKLGTALRIHQELATRDDHAWKAKAAELAKELSRRAPRAKLVVTKAAKKKAPKGVVAKLNGTVIDDLSDVALDLGPNALVVTAPGYQEWSGNVAARKEGERTTVRVELVADPNAPTPTTPEESEEPDAPSRGSARRTAGITTTIIGGLVVLGGGAVGLVSLDRWGKVDDLCPNGLCTPANASEGMALRDQAVSYGNISTGLLVGGGALVVTGLILWVTAPSASDEGVAFAPGLSSSSATLTLTGRF